MEHRKIKSIIVEDEMYDRQLIEKIITTYYQDYIDLLDSVATANDAITSIQKYKPELLFMDIELNGDRNGAFNVLEQIDEGTKIIFVTAKSEQDDLLRAIRLSCIDYLIKPTKVSDFELPIKKVYNEINHSSLEYHSNVKILRHNVEATNLREAKISLQEGYSYTPVSVSKIIRCESEGNYTKFYFEGNTHSLVNGNLKLFEERLNDYGFCRINKTNLINLSHLQSFSKKNKNWEAYMSDNATLYISPSHKQGFLIKYNNMHLIF